MVSVNGDVKYDYDDKEVLCELFADTRAEVTSDMEVVGLAKGFAFAHGSSVMTADGQVAFMKSNGEWNWVE